MPAVIRQSILTAGLLALVSATGFAQDQKVPRLALSQSTWEFGEVWHEEKPVITLTVSNEGNADLRLLNVRTTCGCTVAQPKRNVIPPGESTDMRVQYDTNGKQGQVSSKVIITSNDPFREELHFPIKGVVKRAITRKPLGGLVIRSLDGSPGQTNAMPCILENQMPTPMRLELQKNTFEELDVRIQEVRPGLEYAIVARTNRPLEPGIIRGKLQFSTGLEKEPVFELHAKVQICHTTEASPAAMQVPKSNLDQAFRRKIDVYHYGDQDPSSFRLTGFKCDNPNTYIKMGDTLPPKDWQRRREPAVKARAEVFVTLPAPNDIPEEGIVIELSTSDPARPKLDVLITKDKSKFEDIMYGRWSGQE